MAAQLLLPPVLIATFTRTNEYKGLSREVGLYENRHLGMHFRNVVHERTGRRLKIPGILVWV